MFSLSNPVSTNQETVLFSLSYNSNDNSSPPHVSTDNQETVLTQTILIKNIKDIYDSVKNDRDIFLKCWEKIKDFENINQVTLIFLLNQD